MLHILNGEATEAVLSQTSVPGERFSFRDVLIAGPTPSVNGLEWRRLRSRHLAEAYGVDAERCEADFAKQDEVFASFPDHDEVTLWFESDLFCQANLLYVLDRCRRQNFGSTKLSMICIGEFPGHPDFRGLGELNPEELSSLFPQRTRVTSRQLELATRAWEAYRASDPRELAQLPIETAELPFLRNALQLQLSRFPTIRNGLNRVENTALKLIADGVTNFAEIFQRFSEAEPGYGFGDAQFWNALLKLMGGDHSLLLINDGATARDVDFATAAEKTFAITEAGNEVLRGAEDFVRINGIDEWLGGVHLQGHSNIWRWDEATGKLINV